MNEHDQSSSTESVMDNWINPLDIARHEEWKTLRDELPQAVPNARNRAKQMLLDSLIISLVIAEPDGSQKQNFLINLMGDHIFSGGSLFRSSQAYEYYSSLDMAGKKALNENQLGTVS